jgi:asparagine synthase (glutamine-hydrolysing)
MCGINFIIRQGNDAAGVRATVERMNHALAHRGPDADVVKVSTLDNLTIGLGHRRLSIIDTSHNADQPLSTRDGRYSLIYNGEIYNYRELQQELGEDAVFEQTSGDTGVLLASLARWGEAVLPRLNGMWAFVLVDWHERRALIARDRLGKKPVYYHQAAGTVPQLLCSSELKGILLGTARRFPLDAQALLRYLSQSITNDTDRTFFSDIHCVPPGCAAWIDLREPTRPLQFRRYWQFPEPEEPGPSLSIEAAAKQLRELLFDSVRLRLRSDVPIGVMLSGGLDSSSILAAAVAAGRPDVAVFSVVSDDPAESEEVFIRRAASHFNLTPRLLNVDRDPQRLFEDLAEVNWINDQPLTGMSQVAQHSIIRSARQQGVKVLLTGQGADEQLGGYNKFLYLYLMSLVARGRIAQACSVAASFALRNTVFREFSLAEARRYIPHLRKRGGTGYYGQALQDAEAAPTGYRRNVAEVMRLDMTRFSLPQLLHTEDRMSMANSTEMRVPFIDFRIVEFLAHLPPEAKLHGGWTKFVLRQAMRSELPAEICFRKDKKGFNLPEAAWFRGPLLPQAAKILSGDLCAESYGVFVPGAGRNYLESWRAGSAEVTYKQFFGMISLELWLRQVDSYVSEAAVRIAA